MKNKIDMTQKGILVNNNYIITHGGMKMVIIKIFDDYGNVLYKRSISDLLARIIAKISNILGRNNG